MQRRSLNRRDGVRIAAVIAQVAVVFVLWELLDHPAGIGIGFLYLIPIASCGFWFGRVAGLVAAAGCLALYVVSALDHAPNVGAAASVRGIAFLLAAIAAGYAHDTSQRATDSALELDAVRQALTPPQLPKVPGLDAAATLVSAEHAVAGDFYMLTNGPGGWSIALVGDVVGHGLRAAQMATFTRLTLTGITSGSHDPAEILRLANRAVHEQTEGTGEFVTVACVAYHPSQSRVLWASAGHPPPIALPDAIELEPARYAEPLGLLPELEIKTNEAPFLPTHAIMLYTDGLYEAQGSEDRFGIERVLETVSDSASRPAAEIVSSLRGAVLRFANRLVTDDICIVVLRRSVEAEPTARA